VRDTIRHFVRLVAEFLPIHEPIVEFGALQVAGQQGFADLRPLFAGKQYLGTDVRAGPGVDRILDLHNIDLDAESVGTALALETLEHVEFPHRALQEIHRVLRPGGIAVITSHMNCPIHLHPSDYWRFTPFGFVSLLQPFSESYVDSAGEQSFPHTVVGIGFKGERPPLDQFLSEVQRWKAQQ